MATKKKALKESKAPTCSKSVCDLLCKPSDKTVCSLAKKGRGRPKKNAGTPKVGLLRRLINRLLGS